MDTCRKIAHKKAKTKFEFAERVRHFILCSLVCRMTCRFSLVSVAGSIALAIVVLSVVNSKSGERERA